MFILLVLYIGCINLHIVLIVILLSLLLLFCIPTIELLIFFIYVNQTLSVTMCALLCSAIHLNPGGTGEDCRGNQHVQRGGLRHQGVSHI